MSYETYLASRGYKRVTVERTTLTGVPKGHRVLQYDPPVVRKTGRLGRG